MERSADRALYLPSGDWRVLKRVWRHGIGEIKVTLYMVDAVREGQGHAGSTPATSTIYYSVVVLLSLIYERMRRNFLCPKISTA